MFMRKISRLAIVLVFLAGFVSCWDKMEEPRATLGFKDGESVSVSVKGVRDTTIAGGIAVLSNTRWAIDTAALDTIAIPMCRIGSTDGTVYVTGDGTLNLTIAENNDKDTDGKFIPRTLEVRLYVYDKYVEPVSITLPIAQEAGAYRIRLGKESQSAGSAQGEVTVTYDINADESALSIITPPGVQRKIGTEKGKAEFTYEANTTGEERELEITFRINHDPFPEAVFRIIQEA